MSNVLDPQKPSGPADVNNLTVTIDRDLCIGAATCLAIAPEVFGLDNEAKAILLDTGNSTPEDQIVDAARACPTAAITVTNSSGERLFPK